VVLAGRDLQAGIKEKLASPIGVDQTDKFVAAAKNTTGSLLGC